MLVLRSISQRPRAQPLPEFGKDDQVKPRWVGQQETRRHCREGRTYSRRLWGSIPHHKQLLSPSLNTLPGETGRGKNFARAVSSHRDGLIGRLAAATGSSSPPAREWPAAARRLARRLPALPLPRVRRQHCPPLRRMGSICKRRAEARARVGTRAHRGNSRGVLWKLSRHFSRSFMGIWPGRNRFTRVQGFAPCSDPASPPRLAGCTLLWSRPCQSLGWGVTLSRQSATASALQTDLPQSAIGEGRLRSGEEVSPATRVRRPADTPVIFPTANALESQRRDPPLNWRRHLGRSVRRARQPCSSH